MKILYYPLNKDFSHPADRRRFVFWAKERDINIYTPETILNFVPDFIVVTEMHNVLKIKKKYTSVPVIYDLVDGYLVQNGFTNDLIKGAMRNIIKKEIKFPKFDYLFFQDNCFYADKVICSSIEQEFYIKKINNNVKSILDSHHEFDNLDPNDLKVKNNFFWEGLPYTLPALSKISSILNSQFYNRFRLNILTDLYYYRYFNKYKKIDTKEIMSWCQELDPNNYKLIKWSVANLQHYAKKSIAGLIPVENKPFQKLKPENRILLMWRLGLPVITSYTQSYARLAEKIKFDFTCNNSAEWIYKLQRLIDDEKWRVNYILEGKRYLEQFHSKDILLAKWDEVFT